MSKEQELMEFCKKFIEEQQIWGGEVIFQSDHVIENAYEFIEGVCNIVGYMELPEDEE